MSFDPNDWDSWYFSRISRQDATDLLMDERDGGVFLVRDSSSIPGDYVLCVKEDCKVCHYIINRLDEAGGVKFRIGDRTFTDIPGLLSFYKLHYLDTTPLVRPAVRRVEKVQAKHDFDGADDEDLPFRKGDILTVLKKHEEQWWTARNQLGKVGAIPVPYVKPYIAHEDNMHTTASPKTPPLPTSSPPEPKERENGHTVPIRKSSETKYAKVKQSRVPNAYDDTALRLEIGDIIRVTKLNLSGQWEGEVISENGTVKRKGHFPFTHVDVLDYDPTKPKSPNESTPKPD